MSGVDGSGPVPTKSRIHPLYLIFVAIVVVVLSFGLAGLRFLGGILLVASTGFLLTLVIWPSGLTLASRLLRGFGLGLLATFYTGFWLAKFNLLGWLIPVLVVEFLLFSAPAVKRVKEAIRQHAHWLHQSLRVYPHLGKYCRIHWDVVTGALLTVFFIFVLVRVTTPLPIARSDAGFFLGLAKLIDSHNGFIDRCFLLDPPLGRGVSLRPQGFSLLAVVSSKLTGLNLLTVCQCFPLVSFVFLVIPIFLIGRELGGKWGAFLAVFFLCTIPCLAGSDYSMFYFKNFDSDGPVVTLSCWTIYLLVRVFKSSSIRESVREGIWASTVYGLFLLVWEGALYLATVMAGSMILSLFVPTAPKTQDKQSKVVALSPPLSTVLPILSGVLVVLVCSTLLTLPFELAPWHTLIGAVGTYVGAGGQTGGIGGRAELGEYAPPFWEGLYSLYVSSSSVLAGYIVFFVSFLLLLGIVYVYSCDRKILPLILAWLLVLVAMVWPGEGYKRFYSLWTPFLPLALSAGTLLVWKRVRRILPLLLLLLFPAMVYNVMTAPPVDEGYGDVASAVQWIAKNTPGGSVVGCQRDLGYLVAGYAERIALTDLAGSMSPWTEEVHENQLPHRMGRNIGGRWYTLDQFLPWSRYRTFGRVMDMLVWPYLDEEELENLLGYYRSFGIRIDYLLYCQPYSPDRAIGYIRKADILEWAEKFGYVADGILVKFSSGEVLLKPDSYPVDREGNLYAVVVVDALSDNEFIWSGFVKRPPSYTNIILLVIKNGELDKVALCRPHPKPTVGALLSLAGVEAPAEPRYLEEVFRRGQVVIVKIRQDKLTQL